MLNLMESARPLVEDPGHMEFEDFFDLHVGEAYAGALASLRNEADAEDVVQEAMFRLWKNFPQDPEKRRRFFFGILYNVIRELRRARRRAPSQPGIDENDGEMSLQPELVEELRQKAQQAVEGKESNGFVKEKLLGTLNPGERQVLCLMELEGRSVREIAQIVGISENYVKVKAHRARQRLRELARQMPELRKLWGTK